MRGSFAAARIAALAGLLIGAASGAVPWHRSWPGLSILSAVRGAALGWLLGAVLGLPLAWALVRPSRDSRSLPRRRWRRALSGVLSAVALAPLGLWLTLALPGGLLRKGMASGRPHGDARPNLVLITVEAFRPDHLGAYGSTQGLTPNLDAFAREATRYQAAYVSSPWTLPSLAAIFTARSPSQCVVAPLPTETGEPELAYTLASEVPLLSERLGRAGYATAAELTNHLLSPDRGWGRGFDCFRNESAVEGSPSDPTVGQQVTERAWEWLRLNQREPFFLWLHYFDPHVPYNAPDTPQELRAKYPRAWVAHRRTWLDVARYWSEPRRRRYQEFYRRMYAEEVRYADRWVGELLRRIKAAGLYQRSLIVVTADHGEELFDRGDDEAVEHGHSMHESVLWVPLLVKWPQGVEADQRITQTVPVAALHATLLQLAGVNEAGSARGEGLPRRDGPAGAEVFSEWTYYGKQQAALTTDDYKVIYHPDEAASGGRFEVYDRRADRWERHDLAGTPVAAELRARLERLAQAALDTRLQLASTHKGQRLALSEKAKRDLRSLGYLGN